MVYEAVLYLNDKTNLLSCEIECPSCHHKYNYGTKHVHSKCDKCGSLFDTDFNQDIYKKKAPALLSLVAHNNKITVIAIEKYEGALTHIREHFVKMKCWNMSEIEQSVKKIRRCKKCGTCLDCYTCKKCGLPFKKNPNRRKLFCPKCKDSDFVETYIKEVKETDNEKIHMCPHCDSTNVKMTLTEDIELCSKCGSKSLSEVYTTIIYTLIIERKEAYAR